MLTGALDAGTYQDIGILAHTAVGVRFDNALDSASRVQLLCCCHNAARTFGT